MSSRVNLRNTMNVWLAIRCIPINAYIALLEERLSFVRNISRLQHSNRLLLALELKFVSLGSSLTGD
jgi:hypothetical protein